MKRIIILAVVISLTLAGYAYGSIDYPTLGTCTGSNVRLRDNPGTDSQIVGKANESDKFIVIGERRVKGDMWYALDHPTEQGTVWISGRYLDLNDEGNFKTSAFRISMQIRLNYGLRPEKARSLFGKPERSKRERYFFDPAQKVFTEEILAYDGFTLRYVEGILREVNVTRKGHPFGELAVGKMRQLIIDNFGKPADENTDTLIYDVSPVETFTFKCKDDEIVSMTWEEALDG